jgi:hypothetical protein
MNPKILKKVEEDDEEFLNKVNPNSDYHYVP